METGYSIINGLLPSTPPHLRSFKDVVPHCHCQRSLVLFGTHLPISLLTTTIKNMYNRPGLNVFMSESVEV